jgi:hypothetical protein
VYGIGSTVRPRLAKRRKRKVLRCWPNPNWGLFWETLVKVDPERKSKTPRIEYGEPEGAVGGKPAGPTRRRK